MVTAVVVGVADDVGGDQHPNDGSDVDEQLRGLPRWFGLIAVPTVVDIRGVG
jgi:hypothetical protein